MTSVITMAIGIVMIICPDRYVDMLVAALGYVLLVVATVMVLEFLSSKKALINYIYLAGALLIGILGMAVLFYREHVLQMLGLVFGIGLILEGINDLFNAWMYARRAQRNGWWILVLLAIVLIALGVLILRNPFWDTPTTLMSVIGAALLFSSAVGILRVIMTWPFKSI